MKTYAKNTSLLSAAIDILEEENPCTLRQLFYRLVSGGALINKKSAYQRLGKLMTRAREEFVVPFRWMVDHVRATDKPSSWTGLQDFGDTVRDAYRKDYWTRQPCHVDLFVEKDAVAGTVQPITRRFDVALRVIRGYASASYAKEIAEEWAACNKPIFAYYLGDFDPSGFDLERDMREKISRYSGREFTWTRLGINKSDFDEFDLIKLPVKTTDSRTKGFRAVHGDFGTEIDALPPTEIRRRVTEAIEGHIDAESWNALIHVEEAERATMRTVLDALGTKNEPRSTLGEGGGN